VESDERSRKGVRAVEPDQWIRRSGSGGVGSEEWIRRNGVGGVGSQEWGPRSGPRSEVGVVDVDS
jgi:hypothetical protein